MGFDKSLEQRREALLWANEIRGYRARLKKDVRAGRAPYDTFLARGPHDPRLHSMRVREALLCMPMLGRVKVDQTMRAAGVSHRATLGGVSGPAWERLYVVLESYPSVRRRLTEARATVSSP